MAAGKTDSSTQAKQALMDELAEGKIDIGQAVKRMRKITGLSQVDFARKVAGLSVRILNEIETGKANPTVETLNKIARPFGYRVGFVRRH